MIYNMNGRRRRRVRRNPPPQVATPGYRKGWEQTFGAPAKRRAAKKAAAKKGAAKKSAAKKTVAVAKTAAKLVSAGVSPKKAVKAAKKAVKTAAPVIVAAAPKAKKSSKKRAAAASPVIVAAAPAKKRAAKKSAAKRPARKAAPRKAAAKRAGVKKMSASQLKRARSRIKSSISKRGVERIHYTKAQIKALTKHFGRPTGPRGPSPVLDRRGRKIGGRAILPRSIKHRLQLERLHGKTTPIYWKNAMKKNGRRRRRHYESNVMYNMNGRRHARRHARRHYNENRRPRRHYRRNPGLMDVVKTGALVSAGFLTHRGLTGLIKMYAPSPENDTAKTAVSTLIDVAVAAVGFTLANKVLPKSAAELGAGMVASAVQRLVMGVLKMANQDRIVTALSAYPDAEGKQFHSMAGFASYEAMPPGYAGFGEYTQAAAGFGDYTQAAAGFGQITQAAAGVGEYFAQGVQGIGEYEAVAGFGTNEIVNEGIHPNLMAAERELSVAEAVAGLGGVQDSPLESIVQAQQVAAPVLDAPGGSRAGILAGGEGIFG